MPFTYIREQLDSISNFRNIICCHGVFRKSFIIPWSRRIGGHAEPFVIELLLGNLRGLVCRIQPCINALHHSAPLIEHCANITHPIDIKRITWAGSRINSNVFTDIIECHFSYLRYREIGGTRRCKLIDQPWYLCWRRS